MRGRRDGPGDARGAALSLALPVDFAPSRPPARAALRDAHVLLGPLGAVGPLGATTDAAALYAASRPPDSDRRSGRTCPPERMTTPCNERAARLQRRRPTIRATTHSSAAPSSTRSARPPTFGVTPAHRVIEIGHIRFWCQLEPPELASRLVAVTKHHAIKPAVSPLEAGPALRANTCSERMPVRTPK